MNVEFDVGVVWSGTDNRAAVVASALRGAFPPVSFLAVCLVRAYNYVICKYT